MTNNSKMCICLFYSDILFGLEKKHYYSLTAFQISKRKPSELFKTNKLEFYTNMSTISLQL